MISCNYKHISSIERKADQNNTSILLLHIFIVFHVGLNSIHDIYPKLVFHRYQFSLSSNLMNLSRVSNPKNRFQLSAGLNLEKFNTILSGTNHI